MSRRFNGQVLAGNASFYLSSHFTHISNEHFTSRSVLELHTLQISYYLPVLTTILSIKQSPVSYNIEARFQTAHTCPCSMKFKFDGKIA